MFICTSINISLDLVMQRVRLNWDVDIQGYVEKLWNLACAQVNLASYMVFCPCTNTHDWTYSVPGGQQLMSTKRTADL